MPVAADTELRGGEPIATSDLSAAFAALRQQLRAYLGAQVNDANVADDLLQDVFLKAQKAITDGRPPRNLTAWLYTAARNTVIDHYRRRRLPSEQLDENTADPFPIDEEQMHRELAACLRPLAGHLPPIYRDTLLATDFDGRTMQEVAYEQDLSLSAIKSRASRGRRMLKDIVLRCCHVETAGGTVTDFRRRSPDDGGCACG